MNVQEIYPNYFKSTYDYPFDYNPLIESFGTVIVKIDQDDYSGDSFVLLKKDEDYGILIFGWGSCSGCDALQGCSSYQEVEELRQLLEGSIKWGSIEETLDYLVGHDWEGDWNGNIPELKQFIEGSVNLISTLYRG